MSKREAILERQSKVKDYICNRPNEYISSAYASKRFGISDYTFRNDVRAIAESLDGTLRFEHGLGIMYVPNSTDYISQPSVSQNAKKIDKETGFRNAEGYSDPTAGQAITNVELANGYLDTKYEKTGPMIGEVWEGECSNGFTDMLLIICVYSRHCLCLKLNPVDYNAYEPTGALVIKYMGNIYTVEPERIGTKPSKYISKRLFDIPVEQYEAICNMISNLFVTENKANEYTRRVQQLVEREEELEIRKKAVETHEEELEMRKEELEMRKEAELNDPGAALELLLLRQKVEIYERLIFGGAAV